MQEKINNMFGAFADCAVLFPLLILLGAKGLFSPTVLFASVGIAYILAGFYFRIPMPVQPLKSIAIAALTLGASSGEIRLSAAALGIFCLLLVLLKLDRWLEKIPLRTIHMVQVGLSALLFIQAWRTLSSVNGGIYALALAAAIFFVPRVRAIPLMGLAALCGMAMAVLQTTLQPNDTVTVLQQSNAIRWNLVVGLVLPQIALTFANSIVGTRTASQCYFPRNAERVTIKALALSIGFGNLVMAAVGGLPFCHGSGGLTAHVRGGATKWWSNLVIGVFLLLLALTTLLQGRLILSVPVIVVSALLLVTGLHHLQLAEDTTKQWSGKIWLVLSFFLCLVTQNLLWVLLLAVFSEIWERSLQQKMVWGGIR